MYCNCLGFTLKCFYATIPLLDLNLALQSCKGFKTENDKKDPGQDSVSMTNYSHNRMRNIYYPKNADNKPYSCPRCGRSFTVKGNMTRHFKYECNQPPRFQCPYCEFRSKQTSNVMSHIRTRHPDLLMMDSFMSSVGSSVEVTVEQSPAPCGAQKTLYYCPKCLHGFTLKSNRNRHFRYECGHEPRFKCPYCELRSKQTSQIYCTKYTCEWCGRHFAWPSSLRLHQKMACGKPPNFHCTICDYKSNFKGNLKRHLYCKHKIDLCVESIEKHENGRSSLVWEDYQVLGTSTANRSSSYVERKFRVKHMDHIGRYKCSKCAKSYRWKHHLVEHVKASCGQKKAECCPYCSYKSNRKWNLKSHMKRIHASV
ncbi:Zinc finger protein 337 [Camponotus floridanus]|uniref:Zinc finger protein 337 n=1 Tax=Camponotus floridanus TaxID=104421 RepID=E2AEV3_CAMFO|nr:Zinc finger protein 337 [Camponotus floridanus]